MQTLRNGHDKSADDAVRYGEPCDEREITALMLLGHTENSIFRVDVPKSVLFIRRALFTPWLPPNDMGPRGAFGVIGARGGEIKGVCMLMIATQWYTQTVHLEEYIVYVHPDHRKTDYANMLIDWMVGQSDRLGIPLITGILSQQRTEAKCRLYRRKLDKVGEFFMHSPPKMRWDSEVQMSSIRSSSAAA
jgi:GNAT superfamily N-acetyltransferase